MPKTMRISGLGIAVAALAVAACHDTDSVFLGTSTGAPPPTAAAVAEFADKVQDAALALGELSLALAAGAQTRGCPQSFDLGDGVTGTCAVDDDGPRSRITTSGSASIRPSDWWIRVDTVPGDSFHIFSEDGTTTSWGAYGESSMGISGTVLTDGSGVVAGFDVQLFSNGHNWRAATDSLTLTAPGLVATIQRSSGIGTVRYEGTGAAIATVAVVGGCTSIDFSDPQFQDRNYCLW